MVKHYASTFLIYFYLNFFKITIAFTFTIYYITHSVCNTNYFFKNNYCFLVWHHIYYCVGREYTIFNIIVIVNYCHCQLLSLTIGVHTRTLYKKYTLIKIHLLSRVASYILLVLRDYYNKGKRYNDEQRTVTICI